MPASAGPDLGVGTETTSPSARPNGGASQPATARPQGPQRPVRPTGVGWLAILAVVAWPAVEAIRIMAQPAHEVVFGDYALFELATRQAWHLDQLLGPNAHPGFNHLGPAMFYLLAPAVRLLEPAPGLYLGAVLINAAALAATVALVWRRAGSLAALWTAAALNLFCLAIGLDTLRQAWNPFLIIVPMVVFVVLWAASVTRVPGAWLWAAVVGSYQIQTHITTAVFVAVMVTLAGAWAVAGAWRRVGLRPPPGWWRRPSRVTGAVALAVIWLPVTVELFHDRPNNLDKILGWVHHGHNPGIPVGTALGLVLRSIAITPFNHRVWTVPLPDSRAEEVAAVLMLMAGAALVAWLVGRRQWFALALAVACLLAIPLATATVSRAGGDNYAFLTGWLGFVPCVLLAALGLGLLGPRPVAARTARSEGRDGFQAWAGRALSGPAQRGTVLLAAVAVACAATAVVSDLRQRSEASINRAVARASSFAADAEAQLKPTDHWVGFLIASPDDWVVASGVVLELERLGYHSVVDPRFDYLFGHHRTVVHPVQVLFSFYLTNDPAGARAALGPAVSTAGGTVMTSWRPPS